MARREQLNDLGDGETDVTDDGATIGDPVASAGETFAAKLGHLIATLHPADRGPYSPREISAGVEAATGAKISEADLRQLVAGDRADPFPEVANALATFFGVPPAYFTDNSTTARIDEQIAKVVAWRDTSSRALDQYEAQPRAARRRRRPGPPGA
uniref:XRE family transcriptional regulator n=1 Tax=Amycolatopsis sp. CA-096443 TaxID=3239919 RepID=UPI003F49A1CD